MLILDSTARSVSVPALTMVRPTKTRHIQSEQSKRTLISGDDRYRPIAISRNFRAYSPQVDV
jgi:hypothetical protein